MYKHNNFYLMFVKILQRKTIDSNLKILFAQI